jgi:hypothetical protein
MLTKKPVSFNLKIEKRGFYSPEGKWVNLNGKLVNKPSIFGTSYQQMQVLKAKRILNNNYQQTLRDLYIKSFPNPWLLEDL